MPPAKRKTTKSPVRAHEARKVVKKPSPRLASASPPSKASTKPPFFGQGDAEYYEWFEMFVVFEQPVPPAMRKALLAAAPSLCKRDVQWPWPNVMWASTGDQWIHQHLVEAYGTAAAKAKMKKALAKQDSGDDDDDDDDWMDDLLAQGGETKEFNSDIESWVMSMHAKQPILFVARGEDGEAGGTKLGAWHKESVARFGERVGPAIEAWAKKGFKTEKDETVAHALGIVVGYVGPKKVSPALRKVAESD
jgi:hypothetical protein